jgi:hypothetical protein
MRMFDHRVLRRILDLRDRKWQEVGENYIMKSFIVVPFTQGDQVKENEIGGVCSTYRRNEKLIQNFDSNI